MNIGLQKQCSSRKLLEAPLVLGVPDPGLGCQSPQATTGPGKVTRHLQVTCRLNDQEPP